jgi:hypothetical protein
MNEQMAQWTQNHAGSLKVSLTATEQELTELPNSLATSQAYLATCKGPGGQR